MLVAALLATGPNLQAQQGTANASAAEPGETNAPAVARVGTTPGQPAPVNGQPTVMFSQGLADILKLVEARVPPDVIKAFITNSTVAYNPSAAEVIALQQRGVPPDVLAALLARGGQLRAQAVQAQQANTAVTASIPSATANAYAPAPSYAPAAEPAYSAPAYAYAPAYAAYPGYYDYGLNYYGYAWPYYYSYYPVFSVFYNPSRFGRRDFDDFGRFDHRNRDGGFAPRGGGFRSSGGPWSPVTIGRPGGGMRTSGFGGGMRPGGMGGRPVGRGR